MREKCEKCGAKTVIKEDMRYQVFGGYLLRNVCSAGCEDEDEVKII